VPDAPSPPSRGSLPARCVRGLLQQHGGQGHGTRRWAASGPVDHVSLLLSDLLRKKMLMEKIKCKFVGNSGGILKKCLLATLPTVRAGDPWD